MEKNMDNEIKAWVIYRGLKGYGYIIYIYI